MGRHGAYCPHVGLSLFRVALMATSAYVAWVNAGRPYRLATPIAQIKSLAKAAGVTWLGDIGNPAHLQDDFPEDHTPFSFTEWPVAISDYVVCAADMADGPWSDRLLADARAGRAPWLKYMNFRGKNYSVKRNWQAVSSSDFHLHISVRSDFIDRSIGTYNPFTGGSSMAWGDPNDPLARETAYRLWALITGQEAISHPTAPNNGEVIWPNRALKRLEVAAAADEARDNAITAAINALVAMVQQLSSGGGSVEIAPILAAIEAAGQAETTRFQMLQEALAASRAEVAELRERLRSAAQQEAEALADE